AQGRRPRAGDRLLRERVRLQAALDRAQRRACLAPPERRRHRSRAHGLRQRERQGGAARRTRPAHPPLGPRGRRPRRLRRYDPAPWRRDSLAAGRIRAQVPRPRRHGRRDRRDRRLRPAQAETELTEHAMAGLVPACPGQPHLSLRFPNSVQVPINRRAFVRGLAGFVAGWPACAYAQTPRSEYASLERWKIIPSIVVVSAADEPRLSAVREAIDFWNAELSKLGSPFRLGEVTHAIDIIPVDYLYAAFHRTPRTVPDIIRRT